MSSDVLICNLALARIGADQIQSLTEDSAEARVCNLLFTSVRDGLLRAHPWRWARGRQALAQPAGETAPREWSYVYALPGDYLAARYIEPVASHDFRVDELGFIYSPITYQPVSTPRYETAGNRLFADIDDAVLIYTKSVTDPTTFDSLFVEAFAAELAARLVMPVHGDLRIYEVCRNEATAMLSAARAADGNDATTRNDQTPDWVKARL